jgi:hypothetical protein
MARRGGCRRSWPSTPGTGRRRWRACSGSSWPIWAIGGGLVIDETAELKGAMTVGVARQHAGITGQVDSAGHVLGRYSRPVAPRR